MAQPFGIACIVKHHKYFNYMSKYILEVTKVLFTIKLSHVLLRSSLMKCNEFALVEKKGVDVKTLKLISKCRKF